MVGVRSLHSPNIAHQAALALVTVIRTRLPRRARLAARQCNGLPPRLHVTNAGNRSSREGVLEPNIVRALQWLHGIGIHAIV
ncbi:hypothetical protein XSR1_870007 [Xenorhabdus szentirmaii DSM 16338]|uniref:Uncharacterized protein n=1 Tax=Xenorhabdus szentirmaii DSM 16338 TaxID=1427518 RepID=W1J813_9GAMM|nr:hypothetical protein XSR1_870007 [Xenorhabdus szentirmaii DSM 16338]